MTIKKRDCPRCGESYIDYPALSRVDNETDICPECGVLEAMTPIDSLRKQTIFTRAVEILKGIDEREKQSLKDFQEDVRRVKRRLKNLQRRRH